MNFILHAVFIFLKLIIENTLKRYNKLGTPGLLDVNIDVNI